MRRFAPLIVAVALVAGACGSTAATPSPTPTPTPTPHPTPAAWTTFTPPNSTFSVSFPGAPTSQTMTSETNLGTMNVSAFATAGDAGQASYLVMQGRLAAGTFSDATPSNVSQFLDSILVWYATVTSGTPGSKTDVTFKGKAGKQATVTSGTGTQKVTQDIITIVSGDDTYILVVIHPTGTTVDTAKFFDSFKLP